MACRLRGTVAREALQPNKFADVERTKLQFNTHSLMNQLQKQVCTAKYLTIDYVRATAHTIRMWTSYTTSVPPGTLLLQPCLKIHERWVHLLELWDVSPKALFVKPLEHQPHVFHTPQKCSCQGVKC